MERDKLTQQLLRILRSVDIRYDLRKGPRSCAAGELAVVLRQLRARYGDAVG